MDDDKLIMMIKLLSTGKKLTSNDGNSNACIVAYYYHVNYTETGIK